MKKRKIAASAILILGITVALIVNSKTENKTPSVVQADYDHQKTGNLDYSKTDPNNINLLDSNITETVANIYLEGFFQKNQNLLGYPEELKGAVNTDLKDLVLPEDIDKTVFSFKPFETGSFPIIADTSPASQMTYLKKIGELSEKNFSSINDNITQLIDRWLDKRDATGLENYIQGAEQEIKDLQTMSVPANWEKIHLQNLNLWQKKKITYQAILRADEDPLKAYMAVQIISDIVEENDSLQKIISDQYNKLIKNQ